MLALAQDEELDAGPKGLGAAKERFCIVARTACPVGDLIRFVVSPDGELVPDLKQKLPGRGVWVTGTRTAVAEAVRRKAFGRGFKREVRVPADFVERTERLLERAALDGLSIAVKAGQAVTGFTKVELAVERDHIIGLLHAAEAASDGIRKIDGAVRRRFGDRADNLPVIKTFNASQLDLAFGRPNVIHAALLAGPASAAFLARNMRLERFRAGDPGERGKPVTAR